MFSYHGVDLLPFCHLYNSTWLNERSVELAVWDWWRRRSWDAVSTLEVGNVLNHYEPLAFDHVVVDRYEKSAGVFNLDVFDVDARFDQIVSISTLEHVRWDEEPREHDGAIRAVEHLLNLLNPGGRMLVTAPTGHNPGLDEYLLGGAGASRSCTLVREGELFDPVWRQTSVPEVRPYAGLQPWAQSVWVVEWWL